MSTAVPAHADTEPGWWYNTNLGVQEAHAEGLTGKGVTIALLDNPIDPSVAWLKDADITSLSNPVCAGIDGENELAGTTTDPINALHPTAMAGLYAGNGKTADGGRGLLGVAPGAHIITIPIGTGHSGTSKNDCRQPSNWAGVQLDPSLGFKASDVAADNRNPYAMAAAINMAIDEGADIIHIPIATTLGIAAGGAINEGDPLEAAFLRAVREGVVVVVGHSNDKLAINHTSSAPADITYFPGLLTVNGSDENGYLADETNVADPGVDIIAPAVNIWTHSGDPATYTTKFGVRWGGNSSGSAIMTGYLALLMNKYPDATGNQILRLALASTYSGKGKMVRDPNNYFGWGAFTFEYATDPASLPDTNPIYLYDIENALDHQAKYQAHQTTELGPWWAGVDMPPSHDIRDGWPKEFALYDEMTGKAPDATAASSGTKTSGATATSADDSSGIPIWVWAAVGAVILLGAAAIILVTTRKRRVQPATNVAAPPTGPPFGAGTPPGQGAPHQQPPPGGNPPQQPPTYGNGQ